MHNVTMDWKQLTDAQLMPGTEFDISSFVCPYCNSIGGFKVTNTEQRGQASGRYHDAIWHLIKCLVCGNLSFIITSNAVNTVSGKFVYQTSWPKSYTGETTQDGWPDRAGKLYIEAVNSLKLGNLNAAVGMARASMQAIMKELQAPPADIIDQIATLEERRKLPPAMKDWANEIRKHGNSALHGDLDFEPDEKIVRESVSFVYHMLDYLFGIPKRIELIRATQKS